METLDIPDADRERIETLRAELAERHAGRYATVETDDVLAYLLDLAEAVDDPEREADPERVSRAKLENRTEAPATGMTEAESTRSVPFDRDAVREQLSDRNRKHSDPDEADRMDLYTIAAEVDVTGRSGMTKDELITATLDRAIELAADPFAAVDVDIDIDDPENADEGAVADEGAEVDGECTAGETDSTSAPDDEPAGSDDSSQLNAMMSLLDTHDDKWRESEGDVRYEVDLPDGRVETARTKDDVRALLFRNY